MPRDPLETVLQLRRRAVDEGRQALAKSLAAAAEAHELTRNAEREIEDEAVRASNVSGDDSLVEAFAAWLPGARHRCAQARASQERQEADVARRRAELAVSRVALEAIQTLLAERRAAAAKAEEQRTQRTMDEAASRIAARP